MKAMLFAAAILLTGLSSQARVEVTCFDNSCLGAGWEIYNWNTGEIREVICKDNDCNSNGWVEYDHYRRPANEVKCIDDDCFGNGFKGYAARGPSAGRWLFSSTCYEGRRGTESDCLSYGWHFRSRYDSSEVRCIRGRCDENGWYLFTPNGRGEVRCKRGSCFEFGWDHW